jgi:hypothetical protein
MMWKSGFGLALILSQLLDRHHRPAAWRRKWTIVPD